MEILGLLLGGGATGLLGSIISQALSIWKASDERKSKAMDLAHEIKLQEMQLASLKEETERELLIAEATASASALSAAYAHDSNTGKPSQWVVNILRLFRPSITVMLIGLCAVIYATSSNSLIEMVVTDAIIYSTIAAMTFWFSDRSIAKSVAAARRLPWQE